MYSFLVLLSCNRFAHNEVLHQWLVLEDLCQTVLDPVLGPGIGHASDGDSRRRKIMLNHASLVNEGNRYQPDPLEDGFIMSAKTELTPLGKRVLRNLYNQDCIHNDKKIMNPLDHPTRILTLGRYTAHMNHLRLVMRVFPQIVHGLRLDDVNQRDRQKWEIVQRLKFKRVLQCLMDIFEGTGEIGKDVSVLGTWAYLYVAWHYIEIFFSLHASLRERIKYAAFVVLFYCIWRNFIIRTNNLTLKRNFLTRECFQDVLLSCQETSDHSDEVDYTFVYSNQELEKILKTVPLRDFIYSQHLKYIAHICRAENTAITKKMLFAKPTKRFYRDPWLKAADLLGVSADQAKRLTQSRREFAELVRQRFNLTP